MTRRILVLAATAAAAMWVWQSYRQLRRELALAEQEAGYWWTAAEYHRTGGQPGQDGYDALTILRQQRGGAS